MSIREEAGDRSIQEEDDDFATDEAASDGNQLDKVDEENDSEEQLQGSVETAQHIDYNRALSDEKVPDGSIESQATGGVTSSGTNQKVPV